ncbi:MAG: sensor histidine kinase, partial [Lactobacillus sp.]|nr:sensor histidine kinase [Lactobacillus sp.]
PRHSRWADLPWWNYMLKSASFILRDTIMMILTVALAVALKLSSKWRNLQQRHKEMLAAQRTTELDNLKSQINPHFLFNTLNTIYALITVDQAKAQNAVHRLSALLRYTLYENEKTIELRKEADFIINYVELMRMRMQSRKINVTVQLDEHDNTHVPPLLFIPLIENAFKYGHTAPSDSSIDISIIVSDSQIICRTRNRFVSSETSMEKTKSSGIGLANLRRRLCLLYGNNASLRTTVNGDCYIATLSIPLSTPPNSLKQ